jgi:serine/threonine protein kinase
MTEYIRSNGWMIHLGKDIGGGGEGRIYKTVEEPRLVAKIYTTVTHEQEAKLDAMLARPPYTPMRSHFPLAWPMEPLYDRADQCVGFLMPYIDHNNNIPLLKLYNPRDRLQTLHGFTWKYLLRAAKNLANVVSVLHENGYIIGDVNESNILISKSALVTLVDCDSIQVPKGDKHFFRCAVGKPEYTPPELQGREFQAINREMHHDNFGLAVLIFQMLMEGVHPFSGVWQGTGNPPTLEQNIQAGNSPYLSERILRLPRRALPFETLPQTVQTLMTRCFGEGQRDPSRRPTAYEWYEALHDAEQQIVSCLVNTQHWYSKHLSSCPWCERMRQGIPDPFPLHPPATTVRTGLRPTIQLKPPTARPTIQLPPYPTTPLTPGTAYQPFMSQVQTQMPAPPSPYTSPGSYRSSGAQTTSDTLHTTAVVMEVLLSIFGVFGVGWCIAGRWGRGLTLLVCSFLIYWPIIMQSLLSGSGGSCPFLLAIGAIIFNGTQLNKEIANGP